MRHAVDRPLPAHRSGRRVERRHEHALERKDSRGDDQIPVLHDRPATNRPARDQPAVAGQVAILGAGAIPPHLAAVVEGEAAEESIVRRREHRPALARLVGTTDVRRVDRRWHPHRTARLVTPDLATVLESQAVDAIVDGRAEEHLSAGDRHVERVVGGVPAVEFAEILQQVAIRRRRPGGLGRQRRLPPPPQHRALRQRGIGPTRPGGIEAVGRPGIPSQNGGGERLHGCRGHHQDGAGRRTRPSIGCRPRPRDHEGDHHGHSLVGLTSPGPAANRPRPVGLRARGRRARRCLSGASASPPNPNPPRTGDPGPGSSP